MEERRFLTTSDDEEEQKMHMQLSMWASNYLRGDVLEEVAMRVPIADLLSASLVSREWHRAVRSSLLYRPCQRPWLLLRNTRNPRSSAFTIHALDPYSRSWISVTRQSVSSRPFEMVGPCFLRGSEGDRLCAITFRTMAISKDPFGGTWEEEMKAPRKFRTDPVVAEVAGCWVIVIGGESSVEYEEEEGSVEVYDKQTGSWKSAGLMPAVFHGSTTAASLYAVAGSRRLYVMQRKTGWLTWFDPASQQWGPVRRATPNPSVSACAITIGSSGDGEKLLVVGVGRSDEGVVGVRVWEVDGGDLGAVDGGERGEEMMMPGEMAGRLFEQGGNSVEVCGTERGGYVCNPWGMGNGVVMFGLSGSGKAARRINDADCGGDVLRLGCTNLEKDLTVESRRGRGCELGERRWEWEWVPVPERVGGSSVGRILCGCSTVRLSDVCF